MAANIFFMVLTVAFGVLVAPASILVIVLGGAWAVTEWRSGAIVARRQIARSVLIGCVLSMTFLIGLGTWWDK